MLESVEFEGGKESLVGSVDEIELESVKVIISK